jgi:hypothetical protein
MMSGVLDVREFPLFDEENGMGVLAQVDEVRRGTGRSGFATRPCCAAIDQHS